MKGLGLHITSETFLPMYRFWNLEEFREKPKDTTWKTWNTLYSKSDRVVVLPTRQLATTKKRISISRIYNAFNFSAKLHMLIKFFVFLVSTITLFPIESGISCIRRFTSSSKRVQTIFTSQWTRGSLSSSQFHSKFSPNIFFCTCTKKPREKGTRKCGL